MVPLLVWSCGLGLFLAGRVLWLGRVAGFHYDEAWAAWFAHRIESEKGFWPIQAMSPYTSAWSHYAGALLFHALGTSLQVYRMSGALLAAGGIAAISMALRRIGAARAGVLLPWVLAFFPVLVMNERFCVEITTFHVFCFGLLCLGLAEARNAATPARRLIADLMIALAVLLGITSHVLFIAPALAAWLVFQPPMATFSRRLTFCGVCAILLAFFLRVHAQIPDKAKSLALLALTSAILLDCLAPHHVSQCLRRIARSRPGHVATRTCLLGLAALSVPAFLLLLFLADGSWSSLFFTSSLRAPYLIGSMAIAPVLALHLSRGMRAGRGPLVEPATLRWFQVTVVITALIAVKPAPRYFEIPLLMLGILLSLHFARLSRKGMATCLAVWSMTGSLQLGFNYFAPAKDGLIAERDFHFLFFRDGTSDTLQKQLLAAELARAGCAFVQVRGDDPRLIEPLRFLALGDWRAPGPTRSTCRFGRFVWVSRKSELHLPARLVVRGAGPGEPGRTETLGPFVIVGMDQANPRIR